MTAPRAGVIELTANGQPWQEVRIPGADMDVRLVRMHVDPACGSSVSLVDFPAGWRRPATGHYLCAEEFVVLRGAITVGDITSVTGDYALLPTGTLRTASSAPDGCLALAAFSGPPTWIDGAPGCPPAAAQWNGAARLADRRPGPDFPGEAHVLPELPPGPLDVAADLLSLSTGRWVWLPAGRPPPNLCGPVLVRSWPGPVDRLRESTIKEENIVLDNEIHCAAGPARAGGHPAPRTGRW